MKANHSLQMIFYNLFSSKSAVS